MKTMICTIFIMVSLFITSCNSSTIEPTEREVINFEVHFQNIFKDDGVLLRIDNSNIFAGEISTDNTVGVAKILKLQQLSGNHLLHVNVNNIFFATREYELQDTLYILIRHFKDDLEFLNIQKGINVEFTNQRPLYD